MYVCVCVCVCVGVGVRVSEREREREINEAAVRHITNKGSIIDTIDYVTGIGNITYVTYMPIRRPLLDVVDRGGYVGLQLTVYTCDSKSVVSWARLERIY